MKQPIKKCCNPECEDIIHDYISSKRRFCCDKCRNRYGFLQRKEKNKNMDSYVRNLKALEKLLNHLLQFDIDRISKEDMDKSLLKSFNLPHMESRLIDGNKITGSTVGNIFLEALKFPDQDWYFFRKIN